MKAFITALMVLGLTLSAVALNSNFVSATLNETEVLLAEIYETFSTTPREASLKAESVSKSFEESTPLLSLTLKESDLQPLQEALITLATACEFKDTAEFTVACKTALVLCKNLARAEGLSFYNIF